MVNTTPILVNGDHWGGMCAECVLCGRSRRSRLPFVVVVLVPTLRSGRRRVVYDVTRGRLSGPFWGCVLAF